MVLFSPSVIPWLLAPWLNRGNGSEIGGELVRGKRLNVHLHQANKRTAEICVITSASIYDDADGSHDPAVCLYDINRFLHPATAGDDVFSDNEFFAFSNSKTAAQDKSTLVFLDENMSFA